MSELVKRNNKPVSTGDIWPQMAKLLGLEGRMIRRAVITLERGEAVVMDLSEYCIADLSPPASGPETTTEGAT